MRRPYRLAFEADDGTVEHDRAWFQIFSIRLQAKTTSISASDRPWGDTF